MKGPLLLVLVWALAAGCGGKGGKVPPGENASVSSLPISLAPVTDDSALAGTSVDTTSWIRLTGIDHAGRLLDRPGTWAVDYGWLHVSREPEALFTIGQMDSLERAGVIDSTTAVGFVWYRIAIQAGDPAELREKAMDRRPRTPPSTLRRALARALENPPESP